ncbi:MAG: hypothetical protein M1839_003161 [Geoglossum umbratile]|nr:MAG: hypothetical protein M1839_003161 [Geoglossum umbratile]
MAGPVVKQEQVATPTAEDGDVGIEGVLAEGENKCEVQPAVEVKKEGVEAVAEQSKEPTAIKTEDNGAVELEKKEDEDDNGTGHKPPVKGPYKHRNNSKFDPSVAEISSDPVEFYFSDSNLPMDKFLFAKVGGVENKPIGLKMIATFKRMKRFQPYEAIVAALKDSEFLELTENEEVKRKVPLEPTATGKTVYEAHKKWEDKTMDRSIYAKGFGAEAPTTQFEIEAFFAPYGPTNAIRLRRMPDRTFKGSVFVEFHDTATQQKFLALEPKPKWKGEAELMWKSKRDYVDEKQRDIKSGKIKPAGPFRPYGEKNGRKEGADQGDWKKRREQDQKSGFRDDRNGRGGRGGHGSKQRGRAGRSGRGGRGGSGGRGDRHEKKERDLHQVPKIQTSTPEQAPPPKDYTPAFSTSPSPESSKKRAREDDDAAEGAAEKKIKADPDVKTEVKSEIKTESGE